MPNKQARIRWDDGRAVLAAGPAHSVGDRFLITELSCSPGRGCKGDIELVDASGFVVRRARIEVLFFQRGVGVGLAVTDDLPIDDDRPAIPLPERAAPRAVTLDDVGTPEPSKRPASRAHRRPSDAPAQQAAFDDPNARSSAPSATLPAENDTSNPPLTGPSASMPPGPTASMPPLPTSLPASEPPDNQGPPRWKPIAEPGMRTAVHPEAPTLPPRRSSAAPEADLDVTTEASPAEEEPSLPSFPEDEPSLPSFPDEGSLPGPPGDDDNRRSDEALDRWHSATRSSFPPNDDERHAAEFDAATLETRKSHAPPGHVIGIDLGTSNTCASVVVDGTPKVIPTRWGTSTIPSILASVDGRLVVGHGAAKRMILNPSETIYGSKRLLGRAFTQQLRSDFQPYFAYPLVETESHGFGAPVQERVVSFEEVSMRLLSEVKAVAEEHLGGAVTHALITVPAYFAETQRQAVREAARRAGLVVGQLVNEPTAAAVAYGYQREQDARLLVFDLGGGTFDVSIVQIAGRRYEVVGTGGDAFLGGIDVDDLIAARLYERFTATHELQLDPTPQMIARLREAAEEAKRGLSVQQSFHVYLRHYATANGRPIDLNVTLTQDELSELARPFTERLLQITRDVLDERGMTPQDIEEVLLVGGGTRMPFVEQAVTDLFGWRPSKRINPDEAVAHGAAILALREGVVELADVLPLSIGIAGAGRTFQRLIARNTPVPLERTFSAPTTEENQVELQVPLFQGEHPDAAQNEFLGTLVVESIPPGPAGTQIDLILRLDGEGMLATRARHALTRRPLRTRIDQRKSSDSVRESMMPYTGPEAPAERHKGSALARFFKGFRKLLAR